MNYFWVRAGAPLAANITYCDKKEQLKAALSD
jgi:hypothetical protein